MHVGWRAKQGRQARAVRTVWLGVCEHVERLQINISRVLNCICY